MTISNILFRVKQNNYSLSKKDEEMLTCTLAPYTFDSFIFAPKAKIRKAATTTSGCYVLQNGKISKKVVGKTPIFGFFCGIGGGKILVFTKKVSKNKGK